MKKPSKIEQLVIDFVGYHEYWCGNGRIAHAYRKGLKRGIRLAAARHRKKTK